MASEHFSGGSFWWRVLRDGLVTIAKGIGCVIGILALAYIGFVVWINWAGGHNGSDKRDDAQSQAAMFRSQILAFRAYHGSYPATLDDLVVPKNGRAPLIDGGPNALLDPWFNPYQFEVISGDEPEHDEVIVWTVSPKGERIESLARRR
jgi:hypothetical protein